MPDARPNAPAVTVASAFRAPIEDRDIAINFASLRMLTPGEEVSIDRAARIAVKRGTAARLVSALNTCREYESRGRITAPGEKPAIVSRAITPSHAETAAAGERASLLFRIMHDLHTPHSYKRSMRITQLTFAANRFLLSLNRQSAKTGFRQAPLELCEPMAIPAPLAQMRQRSGMTSGHFQALYDRIKLQSEGHLAGGVHRDGRNFFNVYYGVQGWQR